MHSPPPRSWWQWLGSLLPQRSGRSQHPRHSATPGCAAPGAACARSRLCWTFLHAAGETAKEAVRLPLGASIGVSYALNQMQDDLVELRRGCLVHRLIQIVRRSMIAVFEPIFVKLFLGRSRQISELERERWNTLADEVVLIAPDEKIALRLLVGLYLHARLAGR